MNRFALRAVTTLPLLLTAGLLASCLSQVGDESGSGPSAVMASAGYAAGSPGHGDISINVRSQAQLVLTGRESVGGSAPILGYLIEPTNAAASAAPLTVFDNSSVKISVPTVYGTTEDLTYRLTVTDANGHSATANATLHVIPALDANRFIQPGVAVSPGALPRFRVVAGTLGAVTTPTAFQLTVKSQVTYRTLDGTSNTVEFDVGGSASPTVAANACTATLASPQPISGQWVAGSGGPQTAPALNTVYADSFLAAKYDFQVPTIEPDAIVRLFQAGLPATANCLPDPGWMYADSASDVTGLQVTIALTSPTRQSDAVLYVLDASDHVVATAQNPGTGVPTTLTLTASQIDPSAAQVSAGAQSLRVAGGGSESKATAQAYYATIDPTSSRTTLSAWLAANCMSITAPAYGADLHAVYTNNFDLGFGRDMYVRTTPCAGGLTQGDLAAVVVNYATVESAAKRSNPILVVAMEYRAPATPTVPAAPRIVSFYAYAPDLTTGDFRRVLTVDFDGRGEKSLPGACNVCHGGTPKSVAGYASGANLHAHFMPWDLESFLYTDTPNAPAIVGNDYTNTELREQYTRSAQESAFKAMNLAVAGTYGTLSPLTGGGFQFTCSGAEFAGPCSLLQLWYGNNLQSATFINQQVPANWAAASSGNANSGPFYLDVFARNCRACHIQQAGDTAAVPTFLAYSDFAAESADVRQFVFQQGSMPGSRLTADRLFTLGASPGSLSSELASTLSLSGVSLPGAPFASLCSAPPATLTAGIAVAVSGACSSFARSYQWTLTKPVGSATQVANADGALASFRPDKPGTYTAQLTITGFDGSQSSTSATTVVGTPVAQPVSVQVSLNTLHAENVLAAAIPAPGPGETVSVDSASAGLTAAVDSSQNIDITATSFAGGTIGYTIHDTVGNTSSSTITVTVSASLVGQNLSTSVASNAGAGALSINLSNLVSGNQGQGVDFTLTAPAGLTGRSAPLSHQLVASGCAGATTASPCTIAYQPPGGVTSSYSGTTVGPNDSFGYSACLTQQSSTCTSGTVSVQIQGQHPLAPFTAIVNSTCAVGCHSTDQVALGANWQVPTLPVTDQELYCAIRFTTGIAPVNSDIGTMLVNPANPTASLFYRKPQGLDSHGGGDLGLTTTQLDSILGWIQEGAYLSTSTDQNCPP